MRFLKDKIYSVNVTCKCRNFCAVQNSAIADVNEKKKSIDRLDRINYYVCDNGMDGRKVICHYCNLVYLH